MYYFKRKIPSVGAFINAAGVRYYITVPLTCFLLAIAAANSTWSQHHSNKRALSNTLPQIVGPSGNFEEFEVERSPQPNERMREYSRRKWIAFLNRIKNGESKDSIRKRMEGLYRDQGTIHLGGSGASTEVYLLDDCYEIHFSFQTLEGLVSKEITERTIWVRLPNGQLVLEKPIDGHSGTDDESKRFNRSE